MYIDVACWKDRLDDAKLRFVKDAGERGPVRSRVSFQISSGCCLSILEKGLLMPVGFGFYESLIKQRFVQDLLGLSAATSTR